MAIMHFKPYRHGELNYAERISAADWESKREILAALHRQGVSRKVMRDQLQAEGFEVSRGQLVRQMMKWKLLPRTTSANINSEVKLSGTEPSLETHVHQEKLIDEMKILATLETKTSLLTTEFEKFPVLVTEEPFADQEVYEKPDVQGRYRSKGSLSIFRAQLSSNLSTPSQRSNVSSKHSLSEARTFRASQCRCRRKIDRLSLSGSEPVESEDTGPYGHFLDISTRTSSQLWVFLRDCAYVLLGSVDSLVKIMEIQCLPMRRGNEDAYVIGSDLPAVLTRQLILQADRIRWTLLGDLEPRHVSILFDAVAILVALEMNFSASIWESHALRDDIKSAVDKMTPSEEDLSFSMHRWSNLLSHACWLVDPDRSVFDPEFFHNGPCKYRSFWTSLKCEEQDWEQKAVIHGFPDRIGQIVNDDKVFEFSSSSSPNTCTIATKLGSECDQDSPTNLPPIISTDIAKTARQKRPNSFEAHLIFSRQGDRLEDRVENDRGKGRTRAKFLNQPSLMTGSFGLSIPASNSLQSFVSCAYRSKQPATALISPAQGSAWSGRMSLDSWKLENTFGGQRIV